MAFDPTTARPETGFDPSTARTDPPRRTSPGFAPGSAGDYLEAVQQGVVFDPLEKVGGAAEHLPGPLGAGARAIGNALPPWLQRVLAQNRAAGERHPWVRLAGNVLPWLAVPGGEGVIADTLLGAAGGALQPLDPKDPNYWRDVAYQAGLGGVAGGTTGHFLRGVGAQTASERAGQSIMDQNRREIAATKAFNDKVAELNAARTATYKSETERVKAINDKIAELNKARTARYQAAQDARTGQNYTRQLADYHATQARAAIPADTTRQWWQEAYNAAGIRAQAPQTLDPQTSATVQNEIGRQLNWIRGQMVYDTGMLPAGYGAIGHENPALTRLQGLHGEVRNGIDNDFKGAWDTEYQKYVLDPIGDGRRLTGSALADYIGQIGKEAQRLRLRAAGSPQYAEDYRIADGLQQAIETIETDARVPNKALKDQLDRAKRAYNLWSMGDEATSAGGTTPFTATPGRLAQVWERRYAGSPARYGQSPNPDDRRLQAWLTERQRAMDAPPGAPPEPPLPHPGQWPKAPMPTAPTPIATREPPTQLGPQPTPPAPTPAAHATGHIISHVLHEAAGIPRAVGRAAVSGARSAAEAGTQTAARRPSQAAAGAGATAGQVAPHLLPRYPILNAQGLQVGLSTIANPPLMPGEKVGPPIGATQ